MENCKYRKSVITKLMGLDEMPPQQQPVSRQLKVLSESYLQKSGSVGKRSRTYSHNNLLRSKKRANRRINDLNKDILSRDFEQKSSRFDGMKSTPVFNSENHRENSKSDSKSKGRESCFLKPNFANANQTVFAWEVKKQLLERLKMTKVSQQLQSDFRSSIGVRSKEEWKHEFPTKLPMFKRLNFSYTSITKSVKTTRSDYMPTSTKKNNIVLNSSTPFSVSSNTDARTENVEPFHGDTEDKSNHSAKEPSSCHSSDLSSEQDSSIRSDEDDSVSSNCVQMDEENLDHKIEAYQHSPNSVLDRLFNEDNLSSSESYEGGKTDLHGLWMQLQLLKSEAEENDSNPEMVTSSDDERSCSGQIIKSMTSFGVKESRDFSYMVDVLDESVFQGGNVEMSFEKWHSLEIMASPSVFEKLEKKYGKQEFWHKSERKLLFDRINSGIMEIVRPRVDLHVYTNPLRRKMRSMLTRNVIEEELLMLLLEQEKGVKDGVSEKAVGRRPWFDPIDELDSLVREIEFFLFGELVAELTYV